MSEAEAADAAAVLAMLLDTSAAAGDPAAVRYVRATAALLGVRPPRPPALSSSRPSRMQLGRRLCWAEPAWPWQLRP